MKKKTYFKPILSQIKSGPIDASVSQPCETIDQSWLKQLGKDDFILLSCHNMTGITVPKSKPDRIR